MSKICSDKAPLSKREWSVSKCYKRGFGVGYSVALNKSIHAQNLQEAKQIDELKQENEKLKKELDEIKNPRLQDLTLRELGKLGSRFGVRNYSLMTKQQLIDALRAQGYNR